MATSLEISKKRDPDRSSTHKTLSFGEKIAKIGPADHERIVSEKSLKMKKKKKKKEITEGKIHSPVGNLAKRANYQQPNSE